MAGFELVSFLLVELKLIIKMLSFGGKTFFMKTMLNYIAEGQNLGMSMQKI